VKACGFPLTILPSLLRERDSYRTQKESLGGFLLLAHSSRAQFPADPGPAGPWVPRQLGVPMQELGLSFPAKTVKHSAPALYLLALKDGAFRRSPVKRPYASPGSDFPADGIKLVSYQALLLGRRG
jgi:hypothetical protein